MTDTDRTPDGGAIPLHPLVRDILESVTLPAEGAARDDIRLEDGQVRSLTASLRTRHDEPHVFVSLCLAAARLEHAGLSRLAAQVAQLARLGLAPDAVERAVGQELALRRAAEALKPAAGPAPGAMQAPTARGAGIRRGGVKPGSPRKT